MTVLDAVYAKEVEVIFAWVSLAECRRLKAQSQTQPEGLSARSLFDSYKSHLSKGPLTLHGFGLGSESFRLSL